MSVKRNFDVVFRQRGAQNLKNKVISLDSATENLKKSMTNLGAGIAAAFSIREITQSILAVKNTTRTFEALRIRLNNLFLSVDAGGRAFERFNQIAATTPFTVRQVVEAGAQLKAFGVDAEKNIKILSDLAAFMGVGIVDAASAMGRAFAGGAGAADIFRERGILNLIKMKTGINDLTKLTLPEFREAMFKTFRDPTAGIAGATTALSKSIEGMESNVQDSFSRLQNAIGEKFAPAYKKALQGFRSFLNGVTTSLTDFRKQAENAIGSVIRSFAKIEKASQIADFIKNLENLRSKIFTQSGFINEDAINNIVFAIDKLPLLSKAQRQAFITAKDAFGQYKVLSDIINQFKDRLKELPKNLDDVDLELVKIATTTGKFTIATEKGIERISALIPEIKLLTLNFRDLSSIDIPEFKIPEPQKDIFDKFLPGPGEAQKKFERMTKIADKFTGNLQQAFLNTFTTGKFAIKDFEQAFIASIESMAAALLARAAIFGILSLIPGLGIATKFGGGFLGFIGKAIGLSTNPGATEDLFTGPGAAPSLPAASQPVSQTTVHLTIQAVDAQSFEEFLRRGGNKAIARTFAEVQ